MSPLSLKPLLPLADKCSLEGLIYQQVQGG
jgi:hypothetical protein